MTKILLADNKVRMARDIGSRPRPIAFNPAAWTNNGSDEERNKIFVRSHQRALRLALCC